MGQPVKARDPVIMKTPSKARKRPVSQSWLRTPAVHARRAERAITPPLLPPEPAAVP